VVEWWSGGVADSGGTILSARFAGRFAAGSVKLVTPLESITPPTREPWAAHAARWSQLGPPLRPCPEDLRRMHGAWRESLPAGIPGRRLDLLSLGVTPEIALFAWAADVHLTAIDSSEEMIRAVWPGNGPNRTAALGEWDRIPLPDASFDLVLCDAGLTVLVDGPRRAALAGELRRLLREDGRVVMRHFAQPERPERVEAIVQAIDAGQLRNFHELKLRLLMAIEAETPAAGVRLGEVHERFDRLFPDRALLASRLGCDLRTVATIDSYRGQDARYAFPSLAEVALAFDDFILVQGPAGHYSGADCCPVFSLTPKT